MEQLDLTTPIPKPSIPNYKVDMLHLHWSAKIIQITLVASTGDVLTHTYTGPTATTLMQFLNTVNLSTTSLQKRIIQRLQTDGVLPAGTITGSPD